MKPNIPHRFILVGEVMLGRMAKELPIGCEAWQIATTMVDLFAELGARASWDPQEGCLLIECQGQNRGLRAKRPPLLASGKV